MVPLTKAPETKHTKTIKNNQKRYNNKISKKQTYLLRTCLVIIDMFIKTATVFRVKSVNPRPAEKTPGDLGPVIQTTGDLPWCSLNPKILLVLPGVIYLYVYIYKYIQQLYIHDFTHIYIYNIYIFINIYIYLCIYIYGLSIWVYTSFVWTQWCHSQTSSVSCSLVEFPNQHHLQVGQWRCNGVCSNWFLSFLTKWVARSKPNMEHRYTVDDIEIYNWL